MPISPDPHVLALFGPTGVGKTALALALADALRAGGAAPVAISVDALQVYRGLEVLTGVASANEQAGLEHRLVSFLPVTQRWSVAEHARRAHAEIDTALAAGRVPIVVGGTGLYLRAALAELELKPPPPPDLRAWLARRLHDEGPEGLHAELARRAPTVAARIAPRDGHRLVRALELHALGETHGRHDAEQLWTAHTRRPTRLVAVTTALDALDTRIAARVLHMVAHGAVDEVARADAQGASQTARQALGFDELLRLSRGELDREQAIAAIQARTRRYARRQLTWLRKLPAVEHFDVGDSPPAQLARRLLASQAAGRVH